jgi:hypothetical protein
MPTERHWFALIQRRQVRAFLLVIIALFGSAAPPAHAQSTAAPRTVCVQPSGDGSKIVPTLDVPRIEPTQSQRSLANPLNPNDPEPLVMLTLGDSAMWGNGLTPDHKYSMQVAHFIADSTGRVVHFVSYAHSGATLSTETGGSYEPIRASDIAVPPGDLNAALPTTLQQEACAASSDETHNAEIVLLNGCINDVSAEQIGLPFPLAGADAQEIARRSHLLCSDPMLQLLNNTLHDFPIATVVVANYWRLVSDKYPPLGLELANGQAKSAPADLQRQAQLNQLLKAQRKAEALRGRLVTPSKSLLDSGGIFQSWGANSTAFLDTSQACFSWAVATANGATTVPNDPNDTACPGPTPQVSEATPPASDKVKRNVRVFLATVLDDPDFSYGAPQTHLWKVPLTAADTDERYAARLKLCKSHYNCFDQADRFICSVNPTAHPNLIGAGAFTDSISVIFSNAWEPKGP